MTPVYEIADRFVEAYAAVDPVSATGMGVAGHDGEMTDYSPDGQEASADLYRKTLAELAAADPENERDRIAAEVMRESLELRLERYEAGEHYRGLSIIGSPFQSVRRVFDLMPRATQEDWLTLLDRMRLVPIGVGSFLATLNDGLQRGETAARRQVLENALQAEAWAGLREGSRPFFVELAESYTAGGGTWTELQEQLDLAAEKATRAYVEAARFLRERYAEGATERDAVGAERYQLHSRGFNGISLDLKETYEWGWEELYRIEREMNETARRIVPGATRWEEARDFLETEPSRAIEGVEAFRAWMQETQDRTIAEMDGVHFDIPEPVKRIETMIAPPGGALAMYYTGPSEDFSRPGRTWYPTGGKTRFPLWGEVSIAYHEGVPGHHLERASVKYLAEELSRFQRLMGGTSGYVEGWALYAERLMGELGYLENPDYYLGMLRAQALRAVRVIVDIGMHLELRIPASERFHGGEMWTPELGQAFANERSAFPPEFMASEITRYLGTPGQAISYKVGERAWLEARENAKRRAGAAFNLKTFHSKAFAMGPMGLGQLKREMANLRV
jgi:uncharacterized protein (DUF885 family)